MQIIASTAAETSLLLVERKETPLYVRLNQCLIAKAFIYNELLVNVTIQSSCITRQQILKKTDLCLQKLPKLSDNTHFIVKAIFGKKM